MIVDERRNQILQVIENKGFVSLHELANAVDVSQSTIRRDLEHLDRIGQIRRTRGGAAYIGESLTAFDDRQVQASSQKQAVAEVAAQFIQPGDTILLDGGTSTLEVAKRLGGKSLQVVTNSLPIINVLSSHDEIELVMLGGYLYPNTGVFLGPLAVSTLEQIHARRLIMSVGGITEKGLFNSNSLLVDTERKMIEVSDEIIVVSDSSKLGHSALAHLCSLNRIDQIVIDSGITDAWKKTLESAGIQVNVVECQQTESNVPV
jgi:DeoR/GlpR family transcriptional regulator of sugar metabolism